MYGVSPFGFRAKWALCPSELDLLVLFLILYNFKTFNHF